MGRHHHRIALTLIAATVWLAAGARVEAQDEEPAIGAEEAQRLFDAGVVHLRESRFEQAAAAFRRSYRGSPRVETMCNLALTYDRWGEHRDLALRAYRTCARDDAIGRFREYAERRVAEIEREIALEETEPDEGPDVVVEPDEDPDVEPEDELPPAPPPREPDHTVLYVGLGVGGLALASLGVAIGFALESTAIVDALEEELGPMPTIVRGTPEHERLQRAQTFADVATAFYVLMGSMLAASGAMIIVDLVVAGASSEPAMALIPTGPGAALVGRF